MGGSERDIKKTCSGATVKPGLSITGSGAADSEGASSAGWLPTACCKERHGRKETIRELYRRYWRCMIEKDAEGLRALMAEDYTLTHMTGVGQSGEEFYQRPAGGTFNYYAAEHDSIEVTVSGDSATMTGKSRVLAAVYGGGKHSWFLRGDFTLRKENGTWKFTGSRASTY
jgi:ketosteroid isomerase-like protein